MTRCPFVVAKPPGFQHRYEGCMPYLDLFMELCGEDLDTWLLREHRKAQ
jgi:hypothetical protein